MAQRCVDTRGARGEAVAGSFRIGRSDSVVAVDGARDGKSGYSRKREWVASKCPLKCSLVKW